MVFLTPKIAEFRGFLAGLGTGYIILGNVMHNNLSEDTGVILGVASIIAYYGFINYIIP